MAAITLGSRCASTASLSSCPSIGTANGDRVQVPFSLDERCADFLTQQFLCATSAFDTGGWTTSSLTSPGAPVDPFVVWSAVLFALSIQARYQPDRWAAAIDVDHSKWAFPLENLLTAALDAIPELLHSTLTNRELPHAELTVDRTPGDEQGHPTPNGQTHPSHLRR